MGVKVLFIGGSGRSGSTFLSLLLSQNADAFNIGQIRDLPAAYTRNQPCTCGQRVPDCAYWSKVFASPMVVDSFKNINERRKAFRIATGNFESWSEPEWRQRLASEHAPYLEDLKYLYQAAYQSSGGRMLVDSSKSSEMALALTLIPEFTVFVLNLVRDPRAVAVSWAKRQPQLDRLRPLVREWNRRQKQYAELGKVEPEKFKLLRYEDLTAAPRQTISSVLQWAGINPLTENFQSDDEAAISWENQHLFPPANEEVLKNMATSIVIRAAESWKGDAHKDLRSFAEDIAFPAAKRFGYLRRAI